MSGNGFTRRDILKSLATAIAGGPVLQVIPAEAAEYAHRLIRTEKSVNDGQYAPKYFGAHQYQTLTSLCETILPKDDHSGSAVEAGAPEFIDLLTNENEDYQLKLGGGLMWLDGYCNDHYGKAYLDCGAEQQKQIVDLVAFRRNAKTNPELSQGVAFFAFLRDMTYDGFYTSKIGIEDLEYIGNQVRSSWPGCPPLPK